ncbi:MCE family protein [Mycobacteroides chelonae]|jgi:phospholipid/cholesterol/gamma-HCH transport system substrate-binding protein|uniref:MCE family protein n=1 Tax=Mycobacteroides chelonae TaxID=1774 RepID=A0AB73LYK8_MYCCH|nr:MCE family protein [Mycobacteroides chelonae]MBF9325271.1 MCE family protein [Mycobacteroides chelonae]MBF9351274.1 MCE family protein [Mycobacteroides chelonae]MBF9419447.1 MCE family protein [Mycobacteroides chelonae]MBF9437926.1 MCE family protein [Mycobacteroides chelonae]MBV6359229.1 MCE family protein [Mycobacteroides chelonae]
MTTPENRLRPWIQKGVFAMLAVALVGGLLYWVWPSRGTHKIVGHFASAVGLYPGDDVRILGVKAGRITAVEPREGDVKVTMELPDKFKVPEGAQAIIMAPNLVTARFVQLTPAYTEGQALADGASLGLDKTAVPIEWDEVKTELAKLSDSLGPQGESKGPVSDFINQAASTFDGNGDSFRNAVRELSQAAGRLGDSRTDLFGTIKNLQVLVDALANSNEQIVQFSTHLASVSKVLAASTENLGATLGALNQALTDVRGFLGDTNSALVDSVNKLSDFVKIFSDQSDDVEQILHVAPNGLANFYNIYNPAAGTLNGMLSIPNLANPVQFICGGVFETGTKTEYLKRAEICRERMGPVLRRATFNYAPILLHPINQISAYKGQIIYDTPETEAKSEAPREDLVWVRPNGAPPPPKPSPQDLSALMLGPEEVNAPPPPGTELRPAEPGPVPPGFPAAADEPAPPAVPGGPR